MTEEAPKTVAPKRIESISISVVHCKELRGQRGDQLTAVFKLEYGEKSLGESPKIETTAGQKHFDVNFCTPFSLNVEDSGQLDEICYKPFTCTILEMLPREKKQKEDKFLTLGQCTFDIYPILRGSLTHELNLPVNSVGGSPLEHLKPEDPRPEITVSISVSEPIFTEAEITQFNIMKIVIGSLYSPPETWQISTPQQQQPYIYVAAMPSPTLTDQSLVFSSGSVRSANDKDVLDRRLRWFQANKMVGNSQFIPDSHLVVEPTDQEDGDYRGKDDAEFRRMAEHERPRAWWNTERRCFIDSTMERKLQDKIAQCRYWPLEIFRVQPPASGNQKKGPQKDKGDGTHAEKQASDEDCLISYHGIAYLNLAHLLYPGVTRIRGVFKVEPFYDSEVQEKAKVKGSVMGDVTKQLFGFVRTGSGIAKGKDKRDPRKDKAEPPPAVPAPANAGPKPMPVKGVLPITAAGPSLNSNQPTKTDAEYSAARKEGEMAEQELNPEGQAYRDMKSHLYIDITLNRPLIKKRTKEEQLVRVSDVIPPRPLYPRKVTGADRAVTDYHKQISVVAGQVVEEFRKLFGDEINSDNYDSSHEAIENRRKKLVTHFAESGRYYIFRERLKYAIVKIVREKYLRIGAFDNEDEYQAFLSDLYTYLVDEMRTALNKFLDVEHGSGNTTEPQNSKFKLAQNFTLGSEQLKQFAKEAEIVGDFELANRYYQERLARDRSDPDFWYDYGVFALSLNDLVKAEECFRECLSICRTHLDGLTMCGVVSTMLDEHQLALTCFETVTVLDPENLVAWTLLGLYYEAAGNDIGMEMAYGEAERLAQAKQTAVMQQQQPAVTASVPGGNSNTSGTMSAQPVEGTPVQSQHHPPLTAQTSTLSGQDASADGSGKHVPAPPGKSVKRTSQHSPGNIAHHRASLIPPPKEDVPPPAPLVSPGKFIPRVEHTGTEVKPEFHTIFMHTALYLLQRKAYCFAERALAHHVLHPSGGSSPNYMEVLAKVAFEKRELTVADTHITEVLKVNYRKADAWSLCGHIKYMLGDDVSARQSYERSLAFEADPIDLQEIYVRLGMVYLRQKEYQRARDTFLLACQRQPSAVTWLGVGIGCYRLEQYTDAESALCEANLLNNYDPVIWAYLSLVSLKTNRRLEAEQAYKFSRKLRLRDENLLQELSLVQQEVGFGNPEFETCQ